MKRLFLILCTVLVLGAGACRYPDTIHINGGKFHVQGIALDKKQKSMYFSFTSAFYKTDLEGNITGSITGINGHLGALTFNQKTRKAYASLEMKNDEIGRDIADGLGAARHDDSMSRFYIAEIDVDSVDGLDVPFEKAITLHPVNEAAKDYLAEVEVDGSVLKHRYGCSGVDGITLGPKFGSNSKENTYLYLAYGVYSDTLRCDNDYNVLLCYDLKDLSAPIHKYFIYTGNTKYGVQNLAYDSHTGRMYMAVYKGKKSQFENFRLFAVDMSQRPYWGQLKGVPYQEGEVEQVDVCGAWHFKWGSTGLCPLGDGRYYISINSKTDEGHICDAVMHVSSDDPKSPFVRISE